MKRIIIIAVSLLTSNQLLVAKSKQLIDYNNLILMPSLNEKSGHYSHGSAAHYSAVRYSKIIKKNDIKKVVLHPDTVSKIKNIIVEHFRNDTYIRCECSILQINYTELLSIDDIKVKKRCYSVKFTIQFYNKRDVHTHSTYCIYLTENGSHFYKVEPFFQTGTMENLNWLGKILDLIK